MEQLTVSLPNQKPRNRVFLTLSSVALVALAIVLAYQWPEVTQSWHQWRENLAGRASFAGAGWPLTASVKDTALLEELADATLVEEELPDESAGWPQWRGPCRDGIAAAGHVLDIWPTRGPALLWQQKIGESYSAFVGEGNRAYTLVREGANEVALCLDLENGKEIWRYAYESPYSDGQGSGPRSTPSLVEGKLYTVGATGLFHCFDAATGSVLWSHDLLKEFKARNLTWGVSFSPLVEGEFVFTNPGGANGGSLAAFHKDTGKLLWQSESDGSGYSSPVAVTFADIRQLLFFTNASVVGVEAKTGRFLWRYPWRSTANVATPITITGRSKAGRPLLYVFVSSSYNMGCALLEVEEADGGFEVRSVYRNDAMHNHFSSSVRRGDYLYGFNDAQLSCMNLRTGKTAWQKSGFGKGSLLRVGNHLIVLAETSGTLALVKSDPKEYTELASCKLLRRRCWTVPVLIHGRLLIRDEDTVKCLDLRAESVPVRPAAN